MVTIERVDPSREAEALGAVLHACVHGGASVNFVLPYSIEEATAYWQTVPERIVLAAREGDRIVGTVSLAHDSPPNQRHRAEVAKMFVHPDARRMGVGRALMERLEEVARERGVLLLTLDTEAGSSGEQLYRSMGYQMAGTIPEFALNAAGDQFVATTYYYKRLH